MYCPSCGSPLPDNAKFCAKCGAMTAKTPQNPGSPQAGSRNYQSANDQTPRVMTPNTGSNYSHNPVPVPPPVAVPPTAVPPVGYAAPVPEKRTISKGTLIAIISAAAALLVVVGLLAFMYFGKSDKKSGGSNDEDTVETGKGGGSGNSSADVKKLQSDLELAEGYIIDGKYEEAKKLLDGLKVDKDSDLYADYSELTKIAEFANTEPNIDVSSYPTVTVTVPYRDGIMPEIAEGDVIDGMKLINKKIESGTMTLVLIDENVSGNSETREIEIPIKTGSYEIRLPAKYTTPTLNGADMRLVSTDVSNYPEVKAYFRVEDPYSGEPVYGLTNESFVINERLTGGEYVSREVHSAEMIKENEGLNISLVADKSLSISSYDMDKIKQVMRQFVNALNYNVGDKAEVLAFDTIVQQMCTFTGDPTRLVNGINSMFPDGDTALYNAIRDGISHASMRGGARCVIAFTDGQDNQSTYSPYEIINYSLQKQVPVYIIGVGYDCEESELRSVANGTGGRYWFIDDLGDLTEIYNQIYQEQIELYAVTYSSDSSVNAYCERSLDVSISGGGYYAECEETFTPAEIVQPVKHASRYEVIKEPVTWNEAKERCEQLGGHLVTITSQAEQDEIIRLITANGIKYTWLGGYTSHNYDGTVVGHWITGEAFTYAPWGTGEPSRVDKDGTDEYFIILWNIERKGGWTWNDERDNPFGVNPGMKDDIGFVCEYED